MSVRAFVLAILCFFDSLAAGADLAIETSRDEPLLDQRLTESLGGECF